MSWRIDSMPSSNTHNFFCNDVYGNINKNIQYKLKDNINYFRVFGQGPDPYFFYNFHLTRRSKTVYKINQLMQHSKVNEHFVRLINYINENTFYDNGQVIAYLYGQICHFVLDSTVHPFIIYCSGIYDEKKPETYKYNGLHEEIEYYIDCYLIFKREKILPKNYKVYKKIFNIGKFNKALSATIDTVVKDVYDFDNASKIYYKSIMDMKKFYHVFNYDRFGIKKFVYSIMDYLCINRCVKKKELSFHVDPMSKLDYLNKDKNIWNHPCDVNEKYNLCFDELYADALDKAKNIINEIDEMLKNRKIDNEFIEELFGNLDYGTGKNCDLGLEYKFFKF